MAERAAQVPYSEAPPAPSGAVAENGSGASPLNLRATPDAFGAPIAAGVWKVGEATEKLADKYGGMVNETLMTNADAALAQKVGQIKAAYLQKTGMAAMNAFPQYQKDLDDARLEARADLPMGAAHGFDMLATRTIANHIADGSTYAAGQLKQAQIDSGTNLRNASIQAVLDPAVASNPQRVKYHQDTALYSLQMPLDENQPGIKKDPDTGILSFDESSLAGQALKANLNAERDNTITQVQGNRFDTLSKTDPLGAFDLYKQVRDDLPRSTQVHIDSMLTPRVFDARVNQGTTAVLAHSEQEHAAMLYSPSSSGSSANNLGNVKTPEGAKNGTADFVNPATPTDGAMLTADTLRSGYRNLTLEQIAKKWTGETPEKVAAWVANTSKASGIDPGAVVNMDDPSQLKSLLKGIAMAEKSPADRAKFTDDVISQGVESSLSGKQPETTEGQPVQKNYRTNENGGVFTTADYYRTHSEDVLQRGDALAEQEMPGDLQYKRAMRETLSNYMNKVVSNDAAQKTLDNKNVIRAINGELTKNNPPLTEDELQAIPGVNDLLNKVKAQDPKFAEGIPAMIAKNARRNTTTNSANGYNAILQTLDAVDPAAGEGHLHSLFARNDETGINKKDYTDALKSNSEDWNFKSFLSKNMKTIANAGGNIDGKGEQRAVDFYNAAIEAKQSKSAKEISLSDMLNPESTNYLGGITTGFMPSRAQQIASRSGGAPKSEAPVLTDKSQYDKLPSGTEYIRNGSRYRKP